MYRIILLYFNGIPFVHNPSGSPMHLNNWALFFNNSVIRGSWTTRTGPRLRRTGPLRLGNPAYADIYHSIFDIEPMFLSTRCSLDFFPRDNSDVSVLRVLQTQGFPDIKMYRRTISLVHDLMMKNCENYLNMTHFI